MDLTEKQIAYFWERVDMSGGPDACWDWTACCFKSGYGAVTYNYKVWGTHNLALTLTNGLPQPDKTFALHSCKQNRKCCNPAHLRWGDAADNSGDMINDGTNIVPKFKGESHPMSKLTENQVLEIRAKWATGRYVFYTQLAAEYGVWGSTINVIVNRKKWKHI